MHPGERRILNYWLVEELGHDRLGRVFRAEEARARRMVVLRLLRVSGVAPADRVQAARAALRRRIRAAAAVVHPNIAAVLDFATHEDLEVLSLEDVQGDSLAELAARDELLPLDDVLWHASQIAAGLEAAHARGVTHGRISPANVRMGRDGRARLLDLGIPRPTEVAYQMAGLADGDVLATEQRRDVHALARTIQFMVTGSDETAALREAKRLPGLGGAIMRAVTGVLQSHGADVTRLRAALVEVARQTPAHPHVAERPVRRPAPVRRHAPVQPPPLVVPASPVSDRQTEPRILKRPEAPVAGEPRAVPLPDQPGPALMPAAVLVSPADGWSAQRGDAKASRRDMGVLVPERRSQRRSLAPRLAGALRESAARWNLAFERLRTPSTAQFVASAVTGAVLVLLGVAVVWRPATTPPDEATHPAAEQVAATPEPGPAEPPDPVVAPPATRDPVPPAPETAVPTRQVRDGTAEPPAVGPAAGPVVGALRISVTPRGALVSLDGGPWRPAPVSFIELEPGAHEVRIRREGFPERSYSVTVRAGETTRRWFDLDGGSS